MQSLTDHGTQSPTSCIPIPQCSNAVGQHVTNMHIGASTLHVTNMHIGASTTTLRLKQLLFGFIALQRGRHLVSLHLRFLQVGNSKLLLQFGIRTGQGIQGVLRGNFIKLPVCVFSLHHLG